MARLRRDSNSVLRDHSSANRCDSSSPHLPSACSETIGPIHSTCICNGTSRVAAVASNLSQLNVCANFLRPFRFSLRLIRHLPASSSSIKVDKRAIPIAERPNRPTTRTRFPPSRSTPQPFLKSPYTLPSRIPFSSPAPDGETRRLLLTVRSRQVRRQLQEGPPLLAVGLLWFLAGRNQ